jgi:hypothetical protein
MEVEKVVEVVNFAKDGASHIGISEKIRVVRLGDEIRFTIGQSLDGPIQRFVPPPQSLKTVGTRFRLSLSAFL